MDVDPPVVNKWDGNAIKNALDDATKSVMMSNICPVECFRLIDGRLLISSLAVCFSLLALAYDYLFPFPLSRHVLLGCVLTYFALSCVLTYHTTQLERGTFATVLDVDPSGLDPNNEWSAASNLKRFDTTYNLTLTYKDGKSKKVREATAAMPIERYFDTDGKLQYERVEREVMRLHASIRGKME